MRRSVRPLLLAAYPFAAFFNAPYTEGLFLLGSVGAFYHFHQRRWLMASLFGLLVGFSRPNGCLVSVPLGLMAAQASWQDWRGSREQPPLRADRASGFSSPPCLAWRCSSSPPFSGG